MKDNSSKKEKYLKIYFPDCTYILERNKINIDFPELRSSFFFYYVPGKSRTSKRWSSTLQFSTVADIVRASPFGSESRRRKEGGGRRFEGCRRRPSFVETTKRSVGSGFQRGQRRSA